MILFLGCYSYQDRVYFVPIQNEFWKKQAITTENSNFKYECKNKKIYLWPVLYDLKIRYRKVFGIPLSLKKQTNDREEMVEEIYAQFGKYYEGQNILAIYINYAGDYEYNFFVPYILINNSTKYWPVDKIITHGESDSEYRFQFVYFFNAGLSNVDTFFLEFSGENDKCPPTKIELKKDMISGDYPDPPIQ
jgi:hypothetical protein